jgi:hypothetical protein
MAAVLPLLGFWKYRSQSYFTTDGLQPVTSSSRRAPWDPRPIYFFNLTLRGYSPCVTSSLMSGWNCRLQLLLAQLQRSHSRVRVPRESWSHCASTVADSRLPEPGGPGPRIYIPQEQGGPVTRPGTVFRFRRLLRLVGIRTCLHTQ